MRIKLLIMLLGLGVIAACGSSSDSGPYATLFTVNGTGFYSGQTVLEVVVLEENGHGVSGVQVTLEDLTGKISPGSYTGYTSGNGKLYVPMTAATLGPDNGILHISAGAAEGEAAYTVYPESTPTPTNRVYFERNGGSYVSTMQVPYATVLVEPPTPIRQGYTFAGWYSDPEFKNPWDFDRDRVYTIIYLYSKWDPQVYHSVTYDLQGGTTSGSTTVSVLSGNLLAEPADPVRPGYRFTGWYTDGALRNPWHFSTGVVRSNLTLYAGWAEN